MGKQGQLAGRVAVVTGASRRGGIGVAIARRLLADGASVLANSWTPYPDGGGLPTMSRRSSA